MLAILSAPLIGLFEHHNEEHKNKWNCYCDFRHNHEHNQPKIAYATAY